MRWERFTWTRWPAPVWPRPASPHPHPSLASSAREPGVRGPSTRTRTAKPVCTTAGAHLLVDARRSLLNQAGHLGPIDVMGRR
jgi:hypothetical protein